MRSTWARNPRDGITILFAIVIFAVLGLSAYREQDMPAAIVLGAIFVALISLYFLEAVKRIVRTMIVFMVVIAFLAAVNNPQVFEPQAVRGGAVDPPDDSLIPSATPTEQPQRPHFVTIDLPAEYLHDELSLAQRFADWPSGEVQLSGIPFRFDARASYIETQFEWPNVAHSLKLPNRVSIPVNRANVQSVYLLLNLSYGCDWAASAGSQVGDVLLRLDGGESLSWPLVTGENVREWVVDTGLCSVVQDTHIGTVQQVWSRPRTDTGARAVIDMLRLDIPEAYAGRTLLEIVIEDKSIFTVNSFDPSIVLFGVTVLAQ